MESKSSKAQPAPRRSSKTLAHEPLPTPPPDPRKNTENFFKYPPVSKELPVPFKTLLESSTHSEEFYKTLSEPICDNCTKQSNDSRGGGDGATTMPSLDANIDRFSHCADCQQMRMECEEFLMPLQQRYDASLTAALAAYGAMEQLDRLYSMWDDYCTMEKTLLQRKECLHYMHILNDKVQKLQTGGASATPSERGHEKGHVSDTEAELEKSISLLDSILSTDNNTLSKRGALKQQRERSKSVMVEDSSTFGRVADKETKHATPGSHLLRRQSTYSDGKSKVSKWTKVKAAFKWERANVPALHDNNTHKDSTNGIGLTPLNNEVARYLRVPSIPGGSSADSILSSSSGHFLSEGGTPGTISSASSVDDLDSSCRIGIRRDSSKSDSKIDGANTDDGDLDAEHHMAESNLLTDSTKPPRNDTCRNAMLPPKSSSNKSLRKCMVVPDFEALPEHDVVEIKTTPTRKVRLPPKPLDLNLKQDLNDLDYFYSPYQLKSPKEGTQSLNRVRKYISSPGNSSVPSSPSRHSDFFAEFESEELSSGDFSEPTTPNREDSRKLYRQKQEEINQRYQVLRTKLGIEFEAKRNEWEKMKSNPNTSRALTLVSPARSEETSPKQVISPSLSAKLLEENLTPDFKKKLRKWRVKKQISVTQPLSPNKDKESSSSADLKSKIDWHLWKTGQLKLEGQGLTALPDQKDLPEDFQKKLEQWNKIKRSGPTTSGNDSLKRSTKQADISTKKSSEDERNTLEKDKDKEKRLDKHKGHDKDKLEKLAKLKAIVSDHPAKEIEVKTSAGVMKFEGISRKFTRKLYEWEKARGIGPESSTFALLHPGYCPLDVGRIAKDNHNSESSPTLSRSLSLDSISPNIALAPILSQQASSLSLNDVNELKELKPIDGSVSVSADFKKFEEPEAVMVEVEDHIVETASPLVTDHSFFERQTPVYKYEEGACSDFCNTRSIQSYESHTNLAPLLAVLKRTADIIGSLKQSCADVKDSEPIQQSEVTLGVIRSIYPFYVENLMKPPVLNAISDVQTELSRINELCEKSPLNEACCQEMMEERSTQYSEEFKGLQDSLDFLKQSIHGGIYRLPKDAVPDINVIGEDDPECAMCANSKLLTSNTTDPTDELSGAHDETEAGTEPATQSGESVDIGAFRIPPQPSIATTVITTSATSTANSNNSGAGGGNCNGSGSNGSAKKKLRMRKMGSRQSSKTESDSSDSEGQGALETPRRLKRKTFRLKQRSFDEDTRRSEDMSLASLATTSYVLKVKPGQLIEQMAQLDQAQKSQQPVEAAELTIKPLEPRLALMPVNELSDNTDVGHVTTLPNVFVKTKRKMFTTVAEPCPSSVASGHQIITVIAHDLDPSPPSDEVHQRKHQQAMHDEHQAARSDGGKLREQRSNSLTALPNSTPALQLPERKCFSADAVRRVRKQNANDVPPPLASDSIRLINKSRTLLSKPEAEAEAEAERRGDSDEVKPKRHLYRKHNDTALSAPHIKSNLASHSSTGSGATLKRIEMRVAKTQSSSVLPSELPDKLDNTLPRIYRKLEVKSATPSTADATFEYPISPSASEPSTPAVLVTTDVTAISAPTPTPTHTVTPKPHTPLNERAQRLQRAKAEFLQRPASILRREEIIRSETWDQYRRSDQSFSSAGGDDSSLQKSASVDTITADTATPTASEAGTDLELGNYDSLPRAVSRSGKISSKLGFATLASKFRRGKPRKTPAPSPGNSGFSGGNANGNGNGSGSGSGSALSALCRQSLFTDAILVPQIMHTDATTSTSTVHKSQSSPQASYAGLRRERAEPLNKSQSEQIVRTKKESYV